MKQVLDYLSYNFSWVWASLGFSGLVEIIILTISVYYILRWFQKTQTWTLLKGLIIILAIMLAAYVMQLRVILSILQSAFGVGIIAVFILFQPELRRGLEQLGRRNLRFAGWFDGAKNERFSEETRDAIAQACFEMGAEKVGALIVIENMTPLGEYEKTGIPLDAMISPQLLNQIFEKNTPLHDGAVLVRRDRVTAATCVLPVSKNMSISHSLGTRHRAGIGVSEVSDCFCIIVSEETGQVSVAEDGVLSRGLTFEKLVARMEQLRVIEAPTKRFKFRKGKKNEKVSEK